MLTGVDRYTCPATGETADLPHGSTCAPKYAMGCPDDEPHPECRTCDLTHHYENVLPPQLKAERAITIPEEG